MGEVESRGPLSDDISDFGSRRIRGLFGVHVK